MRRSARERSWLRPLGVAVTGRRTAWLVIVVALLAGGALIGVGGTATVDNSPTAGLPADAQSTTVAALSKKLPSGAVTSALIVYSRPGGALRAADLAAITAQREKLAAIALKGQVSPPQVAKNARAALVAVPLAATSDDARLTAEVKRVRSIAKASLPAGARAQVTGGAAFSADIGAAFNGADITLLIVTATVVALLLLITYRSPILWIIPLIVVGLADQCANALIAILSRHSSLAISSEVTGIVEVLVFGAGTDYALLLIARYREELRAHADRREAMRRALRGAGPAIAASATTVVLALLTLLFASFGSNVALGVGGAIGIVTALVFALVVLPAALVVWPRGIFWPLVPRVAAAGQTSPVREGRVWRRVGDATARRPWPVAIGSLVLLAALAAGVASTSIGLSQADTFRTPAESVAGLKTLSASFPAGAADPVTIITTPAAAAQVTAAARKVEGVANAAAGERTSTLASVTVVLSASPDTSASYTAIRGLRDAVADVPGARASVGGSVATDLDTRTAALHDTLLITPLILLVVLVVLLVLLRAVVAPLVLVATVILSFFAALGAGALTFRYLTHYPGLDVQVPLLSFLFLVALGVDYNIFLITRAQEEAARVGTRAGIVDALAVTGGVITSAGILLAAVFAVLGVLPVTVLTEIGVIVGLGVLLDTLLVRTVLVPALVHLLGEVFWWPGRLRA